MSDQKITATIKKPKVIPVTLSGNNSLSASSIQIKNVPSVPRSESLDGGSF